VARKMLKDGEVADTDGSESYNYDLFIIGVFYSTPQRVGYCNFRERLL
jgi:hypothetical protein